MPTCMIEHNNRKPCSLVFVLLCSCPGFLLRVTNSFRKKTKQNKKQGLGQLLIGAPRLMLLADKHGVVGAALAKGAGDEVLVQALR